MEKAQPELHIDVENETVQLVIKKIIKTQQHQVFLKRNQAFCHNLQWLTYNKGALLLPFYSVDGVRKVSPSLGPRFTGCFPKDSLTLARM